MTYTENDLLWLVKNFDRYNDIERRRSEARADDRNSVASFEKEFVSKFDSLRLRIINSAPESTTERDKLQEINAKLVVALTDIRAWSWRHGHPTVTRMVEAAIAEAV